MTIEEYRRSLNQYPVCVGEIFYCLEQGVFYSKNEIKAEVLKRRFGEKITAEALNASSELEFNFRDVISSMKYDGLLIEGKPGTGNYYKYRTRERGD